MNHRKVSIILLLVLFSLGCNQSNNRTIPAQVRGVWTTDAERYRDRFLELSAAFVIIGARGQTAPTVQLVQKVDTQPSGDGTVLNITSKDLDGNQYHLTLAFRGVKGGEIQIQNQQNIIWKRRPEDNEI